jgi:hypothetical protein
MASAEHPHQAALDKFLAQRPELQQQLDQLNPLAAQAAGISREEYRQECLHQAFEEEAERQGVFAWELTLQLTSASAEEYETQRREVHKEVAQMASMEWVAYCEMNGLKP